jgi:hypothetical protein
MKTAQRSRRVQSRSNSSLLMAGIAILDCGFLFLCVFLYGLILMIFR